MPSKINRDIHIGTKAKREIYRAFQWHNGESNTANTKCDYAVREEKKQLKRGSST